MVYETRADIEPRYKWRLEDIIPSDDEFESMFSKTKEEIKCFASYKGRLHDRAVLLECMNKENEVGESLSTMYVYSKMRLDEDAKNSKYKAMTDRAEMLIVDYSRETSFMMPEIVGAFTEEELLDISRDKAFSDYDYTFEQIAKKKEHYLSDKEESILAEVGSFSGMFQDAFNMFDDADVQFKKIRKDGEDIDMSHGVYSVMMMDEDRDVRRQAFESMFTAYKDMINTISVLYGGNVKKDCFYAKVRKYHDALEMSMSGEDVTPDVYDNLLRSVHASLPVLHDYMDYRRKALGVDELHMYDMHVSIVEDGNIEVPYEEAFKIVKKALEPLGEDYQALLNRAHDEGWIDVYESKGKRSGAYSWGTYGAHPYVLLNYQETTHDIFTIAHELGHAMHSYHSNKALPSSKAGYEIFVAEVASTVNEVLLLKYLMKSRPNMKKFLLQYFLDMFRTTLFRQTQFAEFEKIAHDMADAGDSLTPDALSDAYYELNKKYYGEDKVVNDDLIRYEWARIPHFYNSYYVYKYATGITSAVSIADSILNEGESAVAHYKEFLSAGGSMSPVEILKLAGVDLTTTKPFDKAMRVFKETLEELKSLD